MQVEALSRDPDEIELKRRALELVPLLRESAVDHAADRRISTRAVNAMAEAGLFRVLQPRRWGGYELDPAVFADVQVILARGDVAAAWVYGVLGVHAFHLALFPEAAAKDVWGEDDSLRIASTYMPAGKAEPCDGGFRFSGRWKFSSGCEHCDWILLGGMAGDRAAGDYRTFLLPMSDCRIVDTWHAMGLKGTGSHDIVVEDVFVPEHRVHDMAQAYAGTSPGLAVNDGWVYRLSFPLVFGRSVTNGCIGGLDAMLEAFTDYGSQRVGTTGARTAQDPDAQLACADALCAVEEMKTTLHHNYAVMFDHARRGAALPMSLKLQYKHQSAAVADRCIAQAEKLFRCVGGTGIFEDYPFGRIYQDLLAARQHVSNQSQVTGRNLGATMLGLDNPDPQI